MAIDYDMSIHTNPNAREWSKLFMKIVQDQELSLDDIDEEFMMGWFANAMMAMHDHLMTKGAPINGDHADYLLNKEGA